jgi:hypothetical protein
MNIAALERTGPALPGPFTSAPDPRGVVPTPATRALVASQVNALLASAQSFHELSAGDQRDLAQHMEHIAAYAAELVRDDWWQSARLDQRPVLRQRTTVRPARQVRRSATAGSRWAAGSGAGASARPADGTPARALAAGENLGEGATSRVGAVTRQTLRAIAFPEFVADLIRSTFRAIIDASIQQLDAIRALLGNVSGTVDEFEESNITDSQAREWLAQQFGTHLQLSGGRLSARADAPETPPPWQQQLGLPRSVDLADEDSIEEVLVPAARRKLSQGRLETLSLLVMMGMDRIVVTGGKIRATMAFHIDASEATREANASEFDMRVSAAGSVGFGPWSASVSTSVGYVTSSRSESESEINVAADLTGEVELHFRSDPIQLNRLIGDDGIDRIAANTPAPAANAEAIPWGTAPETRVAPAPRRTSARIDRPLHEPPPLMPPPPVPARTDPASPGAGAAPAGAGGASPAGRDSGAPGGGTRPPDGTGSPTAGGTGRTSSPGGGTTPGTPPSGGPGQTTIPATGGAAAPATPAKGSA